MTLGANLLCMLSMLLWAAGLPAADLLIPLLPPLTLAASRVCLAAAALLVVWVLFEGRGVLVAPWGKGVAVGSTLALGALAMVVGQARTDPITVAVISASLPVVGIALEVVLDGRRLTRALVLGLVLSVLGAVVALGARLQGIGFGIGALLCFASVLAYAAGSRLSITAFPDLTALGRTTVTVTGSALVSVAAAVGHTALGAPLPDFTSFGAREFGALVLFGVGSLALSQVLWIIAVGRLGIGLAALHINATPFYVMLILSLFGAPWSWTEATGAAIVGLGVLIAQGVIPLQKRPAIP